MSNSTSNDDLPPSSSQIYALRAELKEVLEANALLEAERTANAEKIALISAEK